MAIEGKSKSLISSNVNDPLGFIPIQQKRPRYFTSWTKQYQQRIFRFCFSVVSKATDFYCHSVGTVLYVETSKNLISLVRSRPYYVDQP